MAELQIEYSLMSRGIEAAILPTVRELGIGVTAYGVLSRGLLNRGTARPAGRRPARPASPGSRPGNLERNLALLDALEAIGKDHGRDRRAAGHRLGGRPGRGHHPADRHQAARPAGRGAGRAGRDAQPGELAAIEAAVPAGQVAGDRYDAPQMRALDSER